MNSPIDIVVPWVNGDDPDWIKEKEQCKSIYCPDDKSSSNIRFQSWDNLHYWFRAIEKFMPWVNKIFLVTWGHVPEFLNVNHPKLEIVRHSDYIPKEYLPTFNSGTIEMNYHRIKNLSENFIIFNDDVFPLQPIDEEYYFKDNIVGDEAIENVITPIDTVMIAKIAKYTQINNVMIINKHFKKREVQKRHYAKWYCDDYGELLERTKSLNYWYDFAGFYDPHLANAVKKSTLETLWEIEKEELDKASRNHFRAPSDLTQSLIRYWQLCEGNFYPRRTLGKFYIVDEKNYKEIANDIAEQKWRMISINEECTSKEFEKIKQEINTALDKILPEKSSYEK